MLKFRLRVHFEVRSHKVPILVRVGLMLALYLLDNDFCSSQIRARVRFDLEVRLSLIYFRVSLVFQ